MAFVKRKQESSEDHLTITRDRTKDDKAETTELISKLYSIMNCFVLEKEQYEQQIDEERQEMKQLFDGMLERKMVQIRELTHSVTELQRSLRDSQQQSEELRRAVYERDQQIICLKRRVENSQIKGLVVQNTSAPNRLRVDQMCKTLVSFNEGRSDQGAITTRHPLIGIFEDDIQTTHEQLHRKAMTPLCSSNTMSLGNTMNLERRVSVSRMLKKYDSSRCMKPKGKENSDKAFFDQFMKKGRKKSTNNSGTTQTAARGSLPSRAKKVPLMEAPPYRQCVRTSLKMLKKLSMAV